MPRDGSVVYHLSSTVESLRTLASYAQASDMSIVDIGAHGALFAAFAAERAPSAHITIVEPDPELAPIIERNMARHHDWTLVQKAIGERSGRSPFYRNASSTQTSSLVRGAVDDFGGPTSEFDVDVIRLDDLLGDDRPVDLLKVDVQGAESQVIAGGKGFLGRVKRLLIEVTLLDPHTAEVLTYLGNEFGEPARVNLVYSGADLAYTRVNPIRKEAADQPS